MKIRKKAEAGVIFLLGAGLLLSGCGGQPPAAAGGQDGSAPSSSVVSSSLPSDSNPATTAATSAADETTPDRPETTISTSAPITTTSAYVPPSKGPEKLSAEQEKKIREDYYKLLPNKIKPTSVDGIWIQHYLGIYEGAELILMGVEGTERLAVNEEFSVAGYDFTMPSPGYLLHKGNTFYEIADAYEKGIITEEGVHAIQWYSSPDRWKIGWD